MFDRDDCLHTVPSQTLGFYFFFFFSSFVSLFFQCTQLQLTLSIAARKTFAETNLQHLMNERAGPTYGCLGLRSPGEAPGIQNMAAESNYEAAGDGRGEERSSGSNPAALISLVLAVLLQLSCNCNQSDSLILLKCRL